MKIINKKKFIFFWLSIFLVVACLGGGYFFIRYQIFTPLNSQSTEQSFTIEKGEGLREIAADLEKEGLIRNKIYFKYYVFCKGWAARLQAGQYTLSPSLNITQIAETIVKGKAASQEITITIPEGFTLKQIDARLTKAGLIEAGELLKQSQLEGYLFPDTYRFNQEATLDEIISKMRDNFDRKLDEDLRNEIAKQGKTLKEIIIMASLLEKEVATDQDRQIVSGIFWQRLKNSYPLESCATIAYILGIDKWRYSMTDTKVESPYNTYQNIGLLPGPICNPGLSAIEAAVYPEPSDYYFFLSKPDGQTVFSQTLEEHNENKAKYLQ
ncbi:MAG: endolytic transglycosylase MltG [Candidatus Portnoybacteria bacterium]|nr:endolytic transglycosylase MltG [Candidatus Portnoybacteria bacterium]